MLCDCPKVVKTPHTFLLRSKTYGTRFIPCCTIFRFTQDADCVFIVGAKRCHLASGSMNQNCHRLQREGHWTEPETMHKISFSRRAALCSPRHAQRFVTPTSVEYFAFISFLNVRSVQLFRDFLTCLLVKAVSTHWHKTRKFTSGLLQDKEALRLWTPSVLRSITGLSTATNNLQRMWGKYAGVCRM